MIAAHYRTHVESWPGGFHRDQKQDADILARNPLPSDDLDLRGFEVNGYRIDYRGKLVMGFRLGGNARLDGFAGYECAAIRINGTEHVFADRPLAHIAWAPVDPGRRVAGGAILELWVHGQARVKVPVPSGIEGGQLVFQGTRLGAAGDRIDARIENGRLEFAAEEGWPQKHLYLLAS